MSTIRLCIALLLALVALATSIPLVWSDSPETTVRIEPTSVQVSAGDTVPVTIEIHDVVNLGAFQFDLTFDPAIVQVDSVTLGDFPASTGRSVNPLGPKSQAGKVVYGAFSFGDAAGPDGSGTLATVILQARGGGQTPLGLANVQVIDIGGTRIQASTQEATITVSGLPVAPASIPEAEGVKPTLAGTVTAGTVLAVPRQDAKPEAASESPLMGWLITGAALAGIIVLVVLVAGLMARS